MADREPTDNDATQSRASRPAAPPSQPAGPAQAGGQELPRWRHPTLHDVSRLAGCSVSTASRVINDHPNVRESTRQAVHQAIAQLNYRPSALARALNAPYTNLIGVVISDITNPFFAELVDGIAREASALGYIPLLCSIDDDLDSTDEYVYTLLDLRIDGLLVASARPHDDYLLTLRNQGMPVVLVNRLLPSIHDGYVVSDDVASGALATNHLIDAGHERIAHIGGPTDLLVCNRRALGYEQAIANAGRDWSRIVRVPDITAAAAKDAVDQLFATDPLPTALFVFNDYLAIEVLHILANRGIRVPEDLAVVGCDDIAVARVTSIGLTTVSSHPTLMGERGMRMLADCLRRGDGGPVGREVLAPELRIRRTCGSSPMLAEDV